MRFRIYQVKIGKDPDWELLLLLLLLLVKKLFVKVEGMSVETSKM